MQVKLGMQNHEGRRRFKRMADAMQQSGIVKEVLGTVGDKGAAALQLLKYPVRKSHLSQVAAADGFSHDADDDVQHADSEVQIEACLDHQMIQMVIQAGMIFEAVLSCCCCCCCCC